MMKDLLPKPEKPGYLRLKNNAAVARLMKPDGRRFVFHALPYLLVYFGAQVAVLFTDEPLVLVLLSCLIANQLYVCFILCHDCMHDSAFASKAANKWAGRFLALFMLMTYTTQRETHKYHHAFLADPEKDPDEWFFEGGVRQVLFRVWAYWPFFTWKALTRYGPRVRRTVIVEQLANFMFWGFILWCLNRAGMSDKAFYLLVLPVALVSLVLNPIGRAYEHLPLLFYKKGDPRREDPHFNTITVPNRLLALLWANMTYHNEHHAYARVPFYNLPKLHQLFVAEPLPCLVAPATLFGLQQIVTNRFDKLLPKLKGKQVPKPFREKNAKETRI